MQVSREEEAGEGDIEDFDDNSSAITASTAISGDRPGSAPGGGGGGGGGAGDLQTVFGVDAEGTGTGDAAEVVHLVSASERAARVRRGGGKGREGGGARLSVFVCVCVFRPICSGVCHHLFSVQLNLSVQCAVHFSVHWCSLLKEVYNSVSLFSM